jgi:hypothetical protein
MTFYAYYDTDGRITGVNNATDALGESRVVCDPDIDINLSYVYGGSVVSMPAKPSVYHYFDYTTKAWTTAKNNTELRLLELEAIRDTKNSLDITWGGHSYPCTDEWRGKFAAAAVSYNYLGVSPPKLPKDGVDTYIAGANLASICGAQETYFEAVKTNYDSLVVAINNAADDTALAAIDLTAGWP